MAFNHRDTVTYLALADSALALTGGGCTFMGLERLRLITRRLLTIGRTLK